jgi:hypothetical protein
LREVSAQSAVASMTTVKRAALAARFALTQRVAPERFRDHSFLPASLFPLVQRQRQERCVLMILRPSAVTMRSFTSGQSAP